MKKINNLNCMLGLKVLEEVEQTDLLDVTLLKEFKKEEINTSNKVWIAYSSLNFLVYTPSLEQWNCLVTGVICYQSLENVLSTGTLVIVGQPVVSGKYASTKTLDAAFDFFNSKRYLLDL